MKVKLFILLAVLSAALALTNCATSTQTTEFKTISAAETAVNASYSGYLDLVETGKLATNSVPQVSKAYNDFQASASIAILTHGLSVTNPVPSDLATLAANVLTLITTLEGK